MNWPHLVVLPVVLPLLGGAALVLVERRVPRLVRPLSAALMLALLLVAWALLAQADRGGVQAYLVGNWPAPFGVVLALDRLAALMLLLTAVVGCASLLYASGGDDRRGRHFHSLFHFQLMGLNGAFLTADLFNLFVFFEVLLIASYGLLLHGAGRERLRGLDLRLRQGELLAIAGVSGNGQLHLADVLCGVRRPSAWSFAAWSSMSAIRGETTSVVPPRASPGSW